MPASKAEQKVERESEIKFNTRRDVEHDTDEEIRLRIRVLRQVLLGRQQQRAASRHFQNQQASKR